VTTCTLAGARFGYELLWVLVVATLAAISLQEMSARLGAATGRGLSETLREVAIRPLARWPLFALVAVSILVGNAAYQGGNLTGAFLGYEAIAGQESSGLTQNIVTLTIAAMAALLLWFGNVRALGAVLSVLVGLLALAFALTALMVGPDLPRLLRGLLVPSLPEGGVTMALALVGTTIVPYNLFLHASASADTFADGQRVDEARRDTFLSIGVGGLISALVLVTAAGTLFAAAAEVRSASELASALEPVFGPFARVIFGAGLLAAGLTSAVTAPMAAGAVTMGMAGRAFSTSDPVYRISAAGVLLTGTGFALSGIRPFELILLAQAANGLLLPGMAILLLAVMNRRGLIGAYANGRIANLVGIAAIGIALVLGGRLIGSVLGTLSPG
jgi:Mn2+/Fe2+ NRAMP family transporter